MSISSAIDAAVITQVAELLGREPRGLEAVEVVDAKGQPSVIRVASLVDDKPFPTMFWLVDKALSYQIDQLEAGGLIATLQAEIDASEDLQAAMIADHQQFIQMRDANMTKEIKVRLVEKNYYEALQKRGIGGIANFVRIRCLHTYYASHLVRANTIGTWLDKEYL
ncbi:MAG: DUF501 domain-containing protein [Pseudomonadales bacterium]|nr:DUF501 domain-containing protein [Pseudomonadales bacterium]